MTSGYEGGLKAQNKPRGEQKTTSITEDAGAEGRGSTTPLPTKHVVMSVVHYVALKKLALQRGQTLKKCIEDLLDEAWEKQR